jgi:HlyD family secretion protein
VVVENRVQARRVRPGLSADGFIQIADGVAPGEFVVARAGSFLRDGDVVRPVIAETAQAEGRR